MIAAGRKGIQKDKLVQIYFDKCMGEKTIENY